jgi:hypothetical protein
LLEDQGIKEFSEYYTLIVDQEIQEFSQEYQILIEYQKYQMLIEYQKYQMLIEYKKIKSKISNVNKRLKNKRISGKSNVHVGSRKIRIEFGISNVH